MCNKADWAMVAAFCRLISGFYLHVVDFADQTSKVCGNCFFINKWKENNYIEMFIDLWLCGATADAKIMRRKMSKLSMRNRKCRYNEEFSFIPYCSVLIVLFPK